jgi:hypothetical protein
MTHQSHFARVPLEVHPGATRSPDTATPAADCQIIVGRRARFGKAWLLVIVVHGFCATGLFAQASLTLQNMTISSGTSTYSATSTITAENNFIINGTASVTFQAGTTITLLPGFTATGGGAATTFVTVIQTGNAPTVTTTSLAAGSVGVTYAQGLEATGGTAPYVSWAVSGSLPPGLTLNASTGVISGTPTSSSGSPFSFGVTVKDSAGLTSSSQNLLIVVTGSAGCGSTPSREYVRLGGKVIAVESPCSL